MEAIARTKYLKGSPQKTRLVIDLVRGENVAKALAILKFTNKRAATPIAKCIQSAIANATYAAEQQNIAIDPDDLWIKACYVDMGPTKNRRRLRPAPQGRAYQERRHYCHITIELTSEEKVVKEAPKKAAGKKATKNAPKKESVKKGAEKKAEPKKAKDEAGTKASETKKKDTAPKAEATAKPDTNVSKDDVKKVAPENVAKQAAEKNEEVAKDNSPATENPTAEVNKTEGEGEE
ncbi:MAG: 50S ribosomal protein L22 [Pyrinomonadaceae bacterium]